MKTFKQILWFIIPTIVILTLLYIMTFAPQSNIPKFIGNQNYLKLFIDDPIFLKALTNILFFPLIIVFAISILLYVARLIIASKLKVKNCNIYLYIALFSANSLVFYFTSNLKAFMGLPPSAYSVNTIINHLSDYPIKTYYINIPSILISMQVAIIVCFIFWCIDKFTHKIIAVYDENIKT